jgi:DNA-binding SARP family transcriptional activator
MALGGTRGRIAAASTARDRRPKLSLIRGFRLRDGERTIDLARNAQRVLAYLALREVPVNRDHLAQSLWMDTSEERAAANLRTALWRINRLGLALIESRQGDIELGAGVDVDVRRVRRAAAALLDWLMDPNAPALSISDLDADLLPGWYEDWVLAEQERFRQLRLHALEGLCLRLTSEHRFAQAVQAGIAAVACEPLRETAQTALMSAYLAEGNTIDAIRQYRSYRAVLGEYLGIEPGPAVTSLLPPAGLTSAELSPGPGSSVAARPLAGQPVTSRRRESDEVAYELETGNRQDRPRPRESLGVASR